MNGDNIPIFILGFAFCGLASVPSVGSSRKSNAVPFNYYKLGNEKQYDSKRTPLKNGLPSEFTNEKIDQMSSFYSRLAPFYLPSISANLSQECQRDIDAINSAFEKPPIITAQSAFWAMMLVDSWGKFEDGIFDGNYRALGFFEECLRIEVTEQNPEADFIGKYCLVTLESDDDSGLMVVPGSIPLFSLSLFPKYATCMPSSCTDQELERSIDKRMTSNSTVRVQKLQCQTEEDGEEYDGAEIFGIVFFCCLGLLLLVASCFDEFTRHRKLDHLRKGNYEFLLCFSMPANMRKIFFLRMEGTRDHILCLHGIRLLSIIWVIFIHQYTYSPEVGSNVIGAGSYILGFFSQIILNGDKCVDTFLFISGLTCALMSFRVLYTTKKVPLGLYYIVRLVRLTPPVAVYVIYLATISRYSVHGPLAIQYEDYYIEGCRNTWWMDISYLSNIFYRFPESFDKGDEALSCIETSWYLGVDMQLYIVMPLVILPIFYYGKKGLAHLGFWTLMSVAIPAIIIGVNDTYPTTFTTLNTDEARKYYELVYLMPYCRASPYLVGIWAGYILTVAPEGKVKLTKLQVIGGWLIFSCVLVAVLFGMYPYNKIDFPDPTEDLTLAVSIIYGSLHRGLWAACIAWMVIACHSGYGGYINNFLAHPGMQPLSRLSYCIYVVSLPLQWAYLYSAQRPIYFNHLNMITDTGGMLLLIGIGALILDLASEAPVIGIQKIILTRRAIKAASNKCLPCEMQS